MNKYEGTIILNPNVTEEDLKRLEDKYTELINSNGKVEKVTNLGKKQLAYQIKKFEEGIYIAIDFEAEPELIKELERNYKITDEIIKFLTIRVDD